MQIEHVGIESLLPYARNSRTHSQEQVVQIASSIQEFGFNNPVLIDQTGTIIAGHGRVMAARTLGINNVPCLRLLHLNENQKRAYIIADNKLALNAGWDAAMLRLELEALDDVDFDLSLTGFSLDELNELMPEAQAEAQSGEDEVPEPPVNPKTKIGDIWLLGKHRLMCGDSTKLESVQALLGGGLADMLFTDPPYLMDFDGGLHGDGSKSFNAKHGVIKNDKMSEAHGNNFLDAINNVIKKTVTGAFYISFYRLGIDPYFSSLARCGLQARSLIIWNKGIHTLSNSDYMSKYEPIFYGWVNDHKFYGGNNGFDIWDIKRTAKNELHPTMKPVELVEKAVLDGSKKNNIVLDLFGGSGTTLIACEKTGRINCSMELDEKYCDMIIKRWQDYTGKKAINSLTGNTF